MSSFAPSLQAALGHRYQVRAEVSSRRSVHVYEAWDAKHGRAVAVKVAADPRDVERFRSEVEIVSRLQHPAILPLYDSGEGEGFVYFIMPFVRSSSLRAHLKSPPPPDPAFALQVLSDVAGALDYAHAQGVVHRDIKPDNVLVESGRGVVTDFGIALTVGWEHEGESAGRSAEGTLPYMSPEQLLEPSRVGPASDVYALGCLAYEMLSGERPFRAGSAPAVAALKLKGGAEAGPGLARIPPPARAPILRALEVDPSRRPESAEELVESIRDGLARRSQRAWRWSALAGGAVAAALAVAILTRSGGPALDTGRLVVGPIQDRSGDPALATLPTSLVDHLTRELQRTGLVTVVPTETALGSARFVLAREGDRGMADPIRAVAEETGAGIVISGEVVKEGERVGVQLRITDATRGVLVGTPDPTFTTEEDPGDVTGLLEAGGSQLLGTLAVALDTRLSAFVDAATAPPFEAYRSFSEGLERYVAEDYAHAIEHFQAAFADDTTFVAPLLYEALSHSNRLDFAAEAGLLARLEGKERSLSAVERRWLDYRRALLSGDRPAALAAIREAAREAPGSKAVYNLGVEAMEGRRLRAAVEALEALPPDRGPMRGYARHLGALALSHHLLGEYREARRTARLARDLFPDNLLARGWELAALVALGRVEEAERELDLLETVQPSAGTSPFTVLATVAQELGAHGHPVEAGAVWRRLAGRFRASGGGLGTGPYTLLVAAEAHLALGDPSEAGRVAAAMAEAVPTGILGVEASAVAGRVAAASGRRDEAETILEALENDRQPFLFGYHRRGAAMVAVALGEHDRAVELLRRGFSEGLPYGEWVHNHPAFQPLWDHPGYRALTAPLD